MDFHQEKGKEIFAGIRCAQQKFLATCKKWLPRYTDEEQSRRLELLEEWEEAKRMLNEW